jgi:replicative DNA helicase
MNFSEATIDLMDILLEAMDEFALRAESGGKPITGLATGFTDIDLLTTGFQGGQLVVLAGRPGMGKTALALNICDHVAINLGVPILFISPGCERRHVVERLLSARSRVDRHAFRTGVKVTSKQCSALGHAYKDLAGLERKSPKKFLPITSDDDVPHICGRFFINDAPHCDLGADFQAIGEFCTQRRIGLVVIDSLGLVAWPRPGRTRQEEVGEIVRRLKGMARILEIPIMLVAQVGRAVEEREARLPYMRDLRESGSLEEEADIVLLLHRPDYFDAQDEPGLAYVFVAKNREGPTDCVRLVFEKSGLRFSNITKSS